jgi:hypothetical protein
MVVSSAHFFSRAYRGVPPTMAAVKDRHILPEILHGIEIGSLSLLCLGAARA